MIFCSVADASSRSIGEGGDNASCDSDYGVVPSLGMLGIRGLGGYYCISSASSLFPPPFLVRSFFTIANAPLPKATLYKMDERIIAENAGVQSVTYTSPNKHSVYVDMRYIEVHNLTPCVSLIYW
ncbi:hypothetical protein BDQ17DRAFT_751205 [Cyathus striatus]|nr:hypothetical protein BDQ17DRAFT_751205 [Cyathus striatus]